MNFDLSIYYMRYFVENVYNDITGYKKKIDNLKLTNCITIEDLERLTKCGHKVVYGYSYCGRWFYVLVKVCPETVRYKENGCISSERNFIDKKDD